MESTLAAAEEGIIASLDYKLPSVASYVESRNEATFFPQGGNHFSSTGVRTLTFAMSGGQFADLSSLVLKCKVVNDDGPKLGYKVPRPEQGPMARGPASFKDCRLARVA